MNKDGVIGIGIGALGCLIPEGCLDDAAVHSTEQMV